MAKRTQRIFNDGDEKRFLIGLKEFREICIKVCIKAPIYSDAYKIADRFIEQISVAGEKLTGNDKYFFSDK